MYISGRPGTSCLILKDHTVSKMEYASAKSIRSCLLFCWDPFRNIYLTEDEVLATWMSQNL